MALRLGFDFLRLVLRIHRTIIGGQRCCSSVVPRLRLDSRPRMNLLDNLNERQLAAVTLPNQSALILAGAGSGKTRVLTTRIAWLIQTGQVSPQGVLAVTFTNKAAKEMLTRLSAMLPINTRGMWIGTFHGLCNRMLRTHFRDAGLPSTFQILDQADQLGAIKRLLKANNIDDERYPPRNLQMFINSAKEAGLRANAVEVNDDYNRRFVELYTLYDAQCNREGVVDFAELLLRCYELLDRNEILREHYQSRFRHVLVDEFQDTNRLQYAWLKQLAGQSNAVFAVGDDDQCVLAGTEVAMADGTVRPVEQIRVGNMVKSCVGGGKIGPARVWRVHYRTEQTRLVTIRTQKGKYADDDARTRALRRLRSRAHARAILPLHDDEAGRRIPACSRRPSARAPQQISAAGVSASRAQGRRRADLDHRHLRRRDRGT